MLRRTFDLWRLRLSTDLRSSSRPPIDILTSPFARFAKMEAAGGIVLLWVAWRLYRDIEEEKQQQRKAIELVEAALP